MSKAAIPPERENFDAYLESGVQRDIVKKLSAVEEAPDPDKVFQLYALFAGDTIRVAHATNLEPDEVERLSIAGGWEKKLKSILKLQRSGKPGDMERGINRAVNYIQAHRYRNFLERLVSMMVRLDEFELKEFCFVSHVRKDGSVVKTVSARAFADLASALEKCHAMTYQALSDTATDRKGRGELPDDEMSVNELHAAMQNAIQQVKTGDKKASAFRELPVKTDPV